MRITRGDRASLIEAEQKLALYLAKVRDRANVSRGIQRNKPLLPGRDGITQNLLGVGGELLFARWMNVSADLTTHVRRGGADCRLNTGELVDVKSVPYSDYRPGVRCPPLLMVEPDKRREDADIYALLACGAYLDDPRKHGPDLDSQWKALAQAEYVFIGWAPADRVLVPATLRDLGKGKIHVLDPDQLDPVIVACDAPHVRASIEGNRERGDPR